MRDLTQTVQTGMPTFPGDPVVEAWPSATLHEDGYQVTAFGLSTHTGTHVDAPAHTEPAGRTLDEYPVSRFSMEARLVGCRDVGPNAALGADRLPEPDLDADVVVFETGWSRYWGSEEYFEYPHLSPELAAACGDRGLDVAIDGPSIDPMDGDLLAHHELLRRDRLVVENLCNLAGLPDRFVLHAFPLALEDADGSPVRAVADEP